MRTRLAEKEIGIKRRRAPLLYLVNNEERAAKDTITLHTSGGVFVIFVMLVIFLCFGMLFNISLRVQSVNYEKDILRINDMIKIEQERGDRIKLRISELKSPTRIMEIAENDLNMGLADSIKVINIPKSNVRNNGVYEYMSKNNYTISKGADNFIGTIYNIRNIIMIVSESVLTFFIPN